MNSKRFSSPLTLAMITLSATISTSARSRAGFDDVNYTGLAKLTADGDTTEGGGNKAAVNTDVAGTGASIIEQQQAQAAPGSEQADAGMLADKKVDTGAGEAKAVGEPAGERQAE